MVGFVFHSGYSEITSSLLDMPGLYTEILPRGGGEFGVWKKEGGRKLTIVLCEAQGGCYTLPKGGGGGRELYKGGGEENDPPAPLKYSPAC